MANVLAPTPEVYQGQFGEFIITAADRRGVVIYRVALAIAALCFAIGAGAVLWQGDSPRVLDALTPLYGIFCLALGVSLVTIHIYMVSLHRALQVFWAIGCAAAVGVASQSSESLAATVYHHPITLLGVGFTFAALTGLFIKEAFCFNRLETKLLAPLVPLLLLGHWAGLFPVAVEQILLAAWACLFVVFSLRKLTQPIPPDIGDKSVFAYLRSGYSEVIHEN
jgi:uncharacterized integral membrane protein